VKIVSLELFLCLIKYQHGIVLVTEWCRWSSLHPWRWLQSLW